VPKAHRGFESLRLRQGPVLGDPKKSREVYKALIFKAFLFYDV